MILRSARLPVIITAVACLCAVVGAVRPAAAATATANLSVTATVVANCSIDATPVAFGNYDPAVANASTPLDGTGSLSVACTKGTSPTIGLDLGGNSSSSVRRMTDGTDFLAYELYQDGSRSTVWGDSGGAVNNPGAAPSSAARTLTVYGRVSAGQSVSVGSYSDTVVATVTF